MSTGLFIFWGAVGWASLKPQGAGAGIPQLRRFFPWGYVGRLVGIGGGMLGGMLFSQTFSVDEAQALDVFVSGAGALIASRILQDLVRIISGGRSSLAAADGGIWWLGGPIADGGAWWDLPGDIVNPTMPGDFGGDLSDRLGGDPAGDLGGDPGGDNITGR